MSPTSFRQAGNAILWRALQQVGVKLIFLARLVILARLLAPDDFGLLVIAGIAIDILMRITNLGLVPALVQRPEVEPRHYHTAWTTGLVRALLVTGVTILVAPAVAEFLAEPRATDLIRVLAFRPLIEAAASVRVADLTRGLNFRAMAILELPRALANTVMAIALAGPLGVWSLVAGTLAGSAAYFLLSYVLAPYRPRLSFSIADALPLIRFGRWIFAAGVVALIGQSVLRAVIARQLGAADLGLYYLATSLAFLPADVAGEVVGEVAFPYYARLQKDARQVALAFRAILTSLATLLLPAYAGLLALAPSLVEQVLGADWAGTAPIIQVLVLANMIGLLGDTIVPILHGTGRPDQVFLSGLAQSAVLTGAVWFLATQFGVVGAALAWLPAVAVSQLIVVAALRRRIKQPFSGLGPRLAVIGAVSLTAALAALAVDRLISGLTGFIAASSLGFFVVAGSFLTLERRYRLGLFEGLVRAYPRVAAVVGLTAEGNTAESV